MVSWLVMLMVNGGDVFIELCSPSFHIIGGVCSDICSCKAPTEMLLRLLYLPVLGV